MKRYVVHQIMRRKAYGENPRGMKTPDMGELPTNITDMVTYMRNYAAPNGLRTRVCATKK